MSSHKPTTHDASPPPYEATPTQQPSSHHPTHIPIPSENAYQPFFQVGPTPLNVQPVLPYSYYDPRSPYSLAQADARARLRFTVSLLWALATWCLVAYFAASEVMVYMHDEQHP